MERQQKSLRDSGIELIKIFAVILIIISHVIQTLSKGEYISGYGVNLRYATTDLQTFVLIVLRYSGVLGNNIFFICSAWFLLESRNVNQKKLLTIILETWSISVIMLAITCLFKNTKGIDFKLAIKSFFPFTFGTNWYVVCYVLFYALHILLNHCIESLNQKELLKTTTVLGILYCGYNYIISSFYSSYLILWTTIYFIIAYMKKYLLKFCNNIKINILLLFMGIIGNIFIILITNVFGLRIIFFKEQLLHWNNNCSPFLLLAAFSLFNIGRNIHFQNRYVNYVSGLSLLIYIIHENLLVRTYLRPYLWECIYNTFGYDYILFWVFVLVTVIFIVSLVLSILYKNTIQQFIIHIVPKLYEMICKIYKKYEQFVIK